MTKLVLSYLGTLLAFFVIDLVWLGVVAKNFYGKHLGSMMASPINWTAAILFYLLFIIGLMVFAINPAFEKDSVIKALSLGALFGFFCYATYDLTNLATLKNWPAIVTIVDLIWGTILGGLVAVCGYYIMKFIM